MKYWRHNNNGRVGNNCKHNTIIGGVVIVVERELDTLTFNDEL